MQSIMQTICQSQPFPSNKSPYPASPITIAETIMGNTFLITSVILNLYRKFITSIAVNTICKRTSDLAIYSV